MERVTLRMTKQQLQELDCLCDSGEYPNRSEAIRDAVRDLLNAHSGPGGPHERGEAIRDGGKQAVRTGASRQGMDQETRQQIKKAQASDQSDDDQEDTR